MVAILGQQGRYIPHKHAMAHIVATIISAKCAEGFEPSMLFSIDHL